MKRLKIQNLILIEKAEIEFGAGLNIFTGETGSGKSAVLSAIRLIAGERADSSSIRKGAEMAIVEAELEDGTFLRREIYRSGKNRCFIDEAQVNLATLKEATHIERVDQTSSAVFEQQKRMLDTFAGLLSEVSIYETSYTKEKELGSELEKLLQIPKERDLEWARKDLDLIEEVGWKVGEEKALAEEHHFLTHAQELVEKLSAVSSLFSDGVELPTLKRALSTLETCLKFDPKLTTPIQAGKGALLELEEMGHWVQTYLDQLQADPARLALVEKRMGAIESLKRRFGSDIEGKKQQLMASIDQLTHLEDKISSLKKEMALIQNQNRQLEKNITEKRKKAAPSFANLVLRELQSLNIPHAQFEVAVGETFNDIRFLFSANPGLAPIPLEQCASGGELSRLLLAIKTTLAEEGSCLVFDEIDSNVGGQTAAILGQKLKKLAEKRQVICVTHFVQVAQCAIDHFLVSKQVQDEIAYTSVIKLNPKAKEREYSRMLGLSG